MKLNMKLLRNCLSVLITSKIFAIMSPTYIDERVYKNYEIYEYREANNSKLYKKYGIIEVDIIDNCFFVKKDQIKNNYFDERFLYFETLIFVKTLKKKEKKLFYL